MGPALLGSVVREAQSQHISGTRVRSSSAHKTLLQTNVLRLCAIGSNGRARIRRDGEFCRPEVEKKKEKKPMNLPLNIIYDPQKVMDLLEKPNMLGD